MIGGSLTWEGLLRCWGVGRGPSSCCCGSHQAKVPRVGEAGTHGPFSLAGPPGMVSSCLEGASWGGGHPLWSQADPESHLPPRFWFCLSGHLFSAVILAGGSARRVDTPDGCS